MNLQKLIATLPTGNTVTVSKSEGEIILDGIIKINDKTYPITKGVARFVDNQAYTSNFGLQWNIFKLTQLDSFIGAPIFEDRLWQNTKWQKHELKGKKILEAGSGSGCFTEIFLKTGCDLTSFDLSSAVDANFQQNKSLAPFNLFQASIYEIPTSKNFFDYVFCYGVLQHTPDPEKALHCLWDQVKPGGKLAIDWYIKTFKPNPWTFPKYFWRPITTRLSPELLLKIIRFYIPFYLPFDSLLKKIPKLGELIAGCIPIPCWNYYRLPIPKDQKLQWAILGTFDALGATYDFPKTPKEVEKMCKKLGPSQLEVFKGSNGVVANLTKPLN